MSIVLFDVQDLAAGDAFGANLGNLVSIGLLDLDWRNGPILNSVNTASVLMTGIAIIILFWAAATVVMYDFTETSAGWYLSTISILMFGIFVIRMYMIYRHGKGESVIWNKPAKTEAMYDGEGLWRVLGIYFVTTAIVMDA